MPGGSSASIQGTQPAPGPLELAGLLWKKRDGGLRSRSRGLEEGARHSVLVLCERELDWCITREEGNSCFHVVLSSDVLISAYCNLIAHREFFLSAGERAILPTASREVA